MKLYDLFFSEFNAPMLRTLLTLATLGLFSTSAEASYELIGRHLEELAPSGSALETFTRSDLSGVTLAEDSFYIPTVDGYLEKRSLEFQHAIWRAKLDAPSQSSWVFTKTEVCGGDTKGQFYCLDSKKGAIKWKTPTKGVFFSRPLIHGDQIFVVNSHGVIQAYDRNSGQWLWQQSDPGTGTLGLWSQQGPVVFQNYIVTGFPSGTLVAFDPQTGKAMWNESFGDKIQPNENFNDLKSVHASRDYLFASSFSGNLRAWEAVANSKKLLWEKRLSLHAPMTLDEADGVLYASARDGKVYAFDMRSGFLKWEFELPRGLGTQPTLSSNAVWVATSAGTVIVLSKDGKQIARTNDYQAPIWNAITLLSNDEALVLTGSANLRRLHLAKTR